VIECKWSYADVATVLDPDAGNHADLAGLFAATHRPVPGERSVAEATRTPVEDASLDALNAIRERSDTDWPVIIPVLGEPGTGKSHLVRWVWNEFRRAPDESFAIVYIPRIRMNIAGVLERLLDAALKDPDPTVRVAAEDLLRSARAAYQDRDPDRVARELRAEVAFQLKSAPSRRVAVKEGPGALSQAQLEKLVAGLETILAEGADFETYLHSQDSAIGRRVAVLVEGRPEDRVHEVPAGFSVEELASYSPRVAGQSQKFQDVVRRLVVKQEWGSLEAAAALLNDALDRGVSELIAKGTQGRGLTFTEVFRRLRESLHVAGRELVIFVEELKLLGGVERELLESFLDNSAAEGLAPIARVRALVACTTGEWTRLSQDIGTFTSRLNAWRAPRYELDGGAALSPEELEARLLDMAAHYLNAARVGVDELERSFREAEDASGWRPPNACDTCKVRKRCHDAFKSAGADGSEYGLFPFNPRALLRAQDNVQQQQIATSLADGLNPRVLLTGVLAPMLKHLTSAEEGRFPEAALARELNFPPAAEAAMRQTLETSGLDAADAEQAAVLLEMWGEASPLDGDLVSWSIDQRVPKVLEIVAPPDIRVRRSVSLTGTEPTKKPGAKAATDGLPSAVERWRNGTDLVSAERRDLRNRVNDLVLRRIDWNDFTGVGPRSIEMLRELGCADPEQLIRFEETASELPARSNGVRFDFRRNDADFAFLNAAARFAAPAVLQAEELVALAEGLERRATEIESQLTDRGFGRATTIGADHPALSSLAIASVAQGLDPGSIDLEHAHEVLGGLVAEPGAVPKSAAAANTRELFELLAKGARVPRDDVILRGLTEIATREHLHAWLLRRVGLRRSVWPSEDDNVQMLDSASIYDAVLGFATSLRVAPLGSRKPDATRGESAAMGSLGSAIAKRLAESFDDEIDRSRTALTELGDLCGFDPKTVSARQLTESIDAADAAAAGADALVRDEGMIPGGDVRANYRKYAELYETARRLDNIEEIGQVFIETARAKKTAVDRPVAASLYRHFQSVNSYRETAHTSLRWAHLYLDHLTAYIPKHHEGSRNPIVEGFPGQYRLLIERLLAILQRLNGESNSPKKNRKKGRS
jgi:hypothetical protein